MMPLLHCIAGKKITRWIMSLAWGLLLAGCAFLGEVDAPRAEGTETPQDMLPTPMDAVETPTQVFAALDVESTPQATAPLPTPVEDPLRFVFPDAELPPVSAWRPALYPIPWEPTPYDHFYFARPIAADEVNWPLEDYRYGGVFFEGQVHTGVDIPATKGTPVLAAADGKVIWAGYGLYRGVPGDTTDPYGRAVMIQHDFGFQGRRLYTVYGHLQQVFVPRGQFVSMGDELGLVGDTGFVTGPHLHMEVRWGELTYFDTLNPELWLVPPQGWGVLAARLMNTGGQIVYEQGVTITSIGTGQRWQARSYAHGTVNRDPYYQENLVVSDLPAGTYEIRASYAGKLYSTYFEIAPGRVSYISFRGREGFSLENPPLPGADFNPFQSLDN